MLDLYHAFIVLACVCGALGAGVAYYLHQVNCNEREKFQTCSTTCATYGLTRLSEFFKKLASGNNIKAVKLVEHDVVSLLANPDKFVVGEISDMVSKLTASSAGSKVIVDALTALGYTVTPPKSASV